VAVTNDVRIGQNLERMRGAMSQRDLAEAMRQFGYRWSQATVWSVEKGERPLRLTEAEDIATIFGKSVFDLLSESWQTEFTRQLRLTANLAEKVEEAVADLVWAQRDLAAIAEQRAAAIDDDLQATLEQLLRVRAADVAKHYEDEMRRGEGDAAFPWRGPKFSRRNGVDLAAEI
jgi:transcriptional regulator with XRE-family HTH domain